MMKSILLFLLVQYGLSYNVYWYEEEEEDEIS